MSKRYFILLEILIALTLIVLLSIPLIRNPIYFYKKELSDLKELELHRIEKESFNKVKEMLYKNEIVLKDLLVEANQKKQSVFFQLESQKLNIPNFKTKEIPVFCWIYLSKNSKPKKVSATTYYKLSVAIALANKNNIYPEHTIVVQKKTL